MTFSLSPRAFSRAMGCYRYPFVLFVFLSCLDLVVFLSFLAKVLVGTIVMHQEGSEPIQRNNLVCVSLEDCSSRHATDYARVFALRDGHAAGGFDDAQPFCAVVAHASHENPDSSEAEFLGDGM